jgi:hypothetical protein
VRWIQVGEGDQAGENDCKTHGTSMLSLVVGKTVGVARNAEPIVVRMPCRGWQHAFKGWDWINGLGIINDELAKKNREAGKILPSVVSMASYWIEADFLKPDYTKGAWTGFMWRHKHLLDSLAEKGAILVTGSGNGGASRVNGLPANYGKPRSIVGPFNVPSLLVMGGVYSNGMSGLKGNFELEAGLPHAYAPGIDVMVADARIGDVGRSSGTSCSTAITAGLAAYYIRLAQLNLISVETSPQAIKDYIIKTSWSRADFEGIPRPGVWNSVDINAPAIEWTPNTKRAAVLFRREFNA